jgi:hypothetical protein
MKPVQLLGLAFAAAVFAGIVTLVSMGFFQRNDRNSAELQAQIVQNALVSGAVVAGITFIAVLVILALLLLAVDPAQVGKTVDRPVLLPDDPDDTDSADGDQPRGGTPPAS